MAQRGLPWAEQVVTWPHLPRRVTRCLGHWLYPVSRDGSSPRGQLCFKVGSASFSKKYLPTFQSFCERPKVVFAVSFGQGAPDTPGWAVAWGCCDNTPQTGSLKPQKLVFSHFWGPEVQNPGGGRVVLRENHPWPSSSCRWLPAVPGAPWVWPLTPVLASVVTWSFLPLCLRLFTL